MKIETLKKEADPNSPVLEIRKISLEQFAKKGELFMGN